MPNSFKLRLKQLPLNGKLVLVGSFVMIVSVFLPWYQDIDRFKIGDTFLGITGPLYLAGLIVLLSSAAAFGLIILKLMEKPLPKLPLKENYFYIAVSALSALMLVLSASVYFHNKFGVNLADKSMGLGMIVGFVGVGMVFGGGLLNGRARAVDFDTEGSVEPLIEIDTEERVPGDTGLNRRSTIAEFEEAYKRKEAPTAAWGQVQESLNSLGDEEKNTKDLY